jgi:ATP-dependent helicase HrpB
VPPALLARGPLLLLQPRRVAARAIARRIAEEQGLALGEEIGWHVRAERNFSSRTRLLVATEGILTARLVADPMLGGFATVVLDEFHERSVHADLGLALARQAGRARGDLAVVVMSATLDAGPVAAFLGGAPVVTVEARAHPVEVTYAPGLTPAAAVRDAARRTGGHVLCFLPGAPEIERLREELGPLPGVRVLPLHGSLPADAQEEALRPSATRKVILCTNVAETSVTVEGVTEVVDSGYHKVLRYDAERGFDRLERERIPQDSADQRAGRAGRTGPGRTVRLWDARDTLRPRREPEIERIDLGGPVLDVLGWGGDPRQFEWFEAPNPERLAAALALLERLGAVQGHRLTAVGDAIRQLPLPPRLARVLVAAGGSPRAALCCAALSESRGPRPGTAVRATDSDVFTLADETRDPSVRRVARELQERARGLRLETSPIEDDVGLRRALLLGYPDRVARRREPTSARLLLASGKGALLGRESGVAAGEYLLAHELQASGTAAGEPIVRVATAIDTAWLEPTSRELVHRLEGDEVKAVEERRYGRIVLSERPMPPEPGAAAALLAEALAERGLGPDGETLLRRTRFAGLELDLLARLRERLYGRTRLSELTFAELLDDAERRTLDRLAPLHLPVPSGRSAALEYREDGTVAASVKLQELFGLGDSPRLGPKREPVLLLLLAPNGRPVQTTRDLKSFWARTYPEVRKELRGRYPRHPWPEDPWTALPTARAKPRPR